MSRRSFISLFAVLVVFLALLVPAAVALTTYFGTATMPAVGVKWSPTYDYKSWNRVYRPLENWFELYYKDGFGNVTQYETNANSNPFWHNQQAYNVRAFCGNLELHSVNTVTCQHGD